MEQNREPLVWEADEYEHREKSADWFWALGIIAIAASVTAVILGNVLFALVILLGAGVLGLYAARQPARVTFRIDERGVRIGNRRFPYDELESFWVDPADEEDEEFPQLRLLSRRVMMPMIEIPLEGVDPEAVRVRLLERLPEEAHEPSLSERVMDTLGF